MKGSEQFDEGNSSQNTVAGPGHEPEERGGLHRWSTVVSVWTSWLLWGGILKALGVILPVLQSQFTASAWLIGWIVAMTDGMIDLAGPFASPLGRRFGAGMVVMLSGLMAGGALIVASFASSAFQIAIVLAIFAGPGLGIAMVLTRESMAYCFTTGFGTATAIGQTGSSMSMIIFAPLTQLFLDTYGWRGTMLLLGGILLHLIVSGALIYNAPSEIRKRDEDYRCVPTSDESQERHDEAVTSESSNNPKLLCSRSVSFCLSVVKEFNFKLFYNFAYWMVAIVVVSLMFGYELWYIYFVSQCQAKGFTPTDAGYFVMAAGGGNLFGKFLSSCVSCCGARRTAGFSTPFLAIFIILSSIPLLLSPVINSYWAMMTAAIVYSGASGAIATLIEILTRDLLGPDQLASALGWMGIKGGILRFTLGFFPGWIFDYTASYDIAFVILGCIQLIGLAALIFLKWKTRHD